MLSPVEIVGTPQEHFDMHYNVPTHFVPLSATTTHETASARQAASLHANLPTHVQSPNKWVPIDGGDDYGGFDPDQSFDFVDQSGGYDGNQQGSYSASIDSVQASIVGYEQIKNGNVNTEVFEIRDSNNTMEWTLTTARDTVSTNESGVIATRGPDGSAGPSVSWQLENGMFDAWTVYPNGTSTHVLHEKAFDFIPLPPLGGN